MSHCVANVGMVDNVRCLSRTCREVSTQAIIYTTRYPLRTPVLKHVIIKVFDLRQRYT